MHKQQSFQALSLMEAMAYAPCERFLPYFLQA